MTSNVFPRPPQNKFPSRFFFAQVNECTHKFLGHDQNSSQKSRIFHDLRGCSCFVTCSALLRHRCCTNNESNNKFLNFISSDPARTTRVHDRVKTGNTINVESIEKLSQLHIKSL